MAENLANLTKRRMLTVLAKHDVTFSGGVGGKAGMRVSRQIDFGR